MVQSSNYFVSSTSTKKHFPSLLAWIMPAHNAGSWFWGEHISKPQVKILIPLHFKRKINHLSQEQDDWNHERGPDPEYQPNSSPVKPVPSFSQLKSQGMFCLYWASGSLAMEWLPPQTSWKVRMAWVCHASMCCSTRSARTAKTCFRNQRANWSPPQQEHKLPLCFIKSDLSQIIYPGSIYLSGLFTAAATQRVAL